MWRVGRESGGVRAESKRRRDVSARSRRDESGEWGPGRGVLVCFG
jgi:hypothetical protein